MWWMALIGAAAGIASTAINKKRNREELERQKKLAKEKYKLDKQYSDNLYSLQKNEALDQLGIQQDNLDTQLGLSVDDYNTSLLAQAFGIQGARIENASGIGASLAAEGASGTRGNASNEMIRAYAAQGLERNIELQDRQNSGNLNRMTTGANIAAAAIEREKASWMNGGYRYNEKALKDSYNRSMYDLGVKEFDYQITSMNNPFDNFLDYSAGMLSGANSGMQWGKSIEDWKRDYNKPT